MCPTSHIATIKLCHWLAALLLLTACGGVQRGNSRQRQQATDSVLQCIESIERLQAVSDSLGRAHDVVGQMLAQRQLGKRYRTSSRFVEAIAAHNRELELAQQLTDTIEMSRALNDLGTNFRRMGILEEATGYHYQALTLSEQYGAHDDPTNLKNRVISLNGIGNIYMTTGNYLAADSILRAALDGERALGSELGQAINLANIGSIMEHLGQSDSAWTYYRQSYELNRRIGSHLGMALCHTHFGELHEQEGQLDEAIAEYDKAYALMHGTSDTWHWMESCVALARVHIKKNNLGQAQHFIHLTDSIALAINSLEHQAQALNLKYQLARQQGHSQQALDYYILANALTDSVHASGQTSQIQNIRVNYERQRRQGELDLVNKNLQNERRFKNIATLTAALVVLLAGITISFLLYMLHTRKRNELLRKQLEQMRSNFFTNVTHEFRTPLTAIMGISEQLTQPDGSSDDPAHVREQAAIIHRQGNNLLQLINQLLDISKVKSEIGDPEWRQGDAAAFVGMIVESFQSIARQKDIVMEYAAHPERIDMDFPPYYMRRIVGNLVGNALKFTDSGGSVRITCSTTATSQLRLTVADTGRGIEADDLPHIFDTFYMGKAVSHGDMSSGVGLSLVRQIVAAMQGSIVVHSQQGKGSVFTVELPLRHGHSQWAGLEPTEKATPMLSPIETALEDSTNGDDEACRILIVEDHNDVAHYIGQQLQEAYSVYYAHDGAEALAKAEAIVPDLMVTDLMMPQMDGYELCRRIRQHPVLNHIPMIIVTARCSDDDRIRGYEVGADAYLEKPFNADELRTRVATLLQQRRQLRDHFLQRLSGSASPQQPEPTPTLPSSTETDPAAAEAIRNITAGEQRFMKQFVELTEQAIARHRVDLEEMASCLNMTSTQLRRKVRAIAGTTPSAFINDLRMGRAAQLLHDEADLSIGDVADRCGYDDVAYFSRLFKQHHGCSPSQFRLSKNQ